MNLRKYISAILQSYLLMIVLVSIELFLINASAIASTITADSTNLLLKGITQKIPGPDAIRAHIHLGNYLIRKPGAEKTQLDSAVMYYDRGLKLARKLNLPAFEYRCISALTTGKAIIMNDTAGVKNKIYDLISKFHVINDLSGAAECWAYYGEILTHNAWDLMGALRCYTESRRLYLRIENEFGVAVSSRHIGLTYMKLGKLNESVEELLKAYRYFKTAGKKAEQIACEVELADVYWKIGNTQQALYYNTEAYRTAKMLNDDIRMVDVANSLGRQYFNMGMHAEALPYMERSLALTLKTRDQSEYAIAILNVISARVKLNKTNGLLQYLVHADRKMPSVKDVDRINIYCAYGLVYSAIGQPSEAEKWFLRMIQTFDALAKRKSFGNNNHLFLQAYYKTIGEFYLSIHRGEKARPFYEKVMALPSKSISPASASDVHMALYQIDSAAGNYLSGVRHLQIYHRIHDSLFNASSSNTLSALRARYTAERRSKEIALIKARHKSQVYLVEKTRLERNITLAGIAAVFIIACLVYWAYWKKQKINRHLEFQSARIDHQNISLMNLLQEKELLLSDKELLLSEKDWLLKEVHHRVKNNLQLITSLLNFQSSSTSNSDVIDAINISKNRIQAISLIHLKLSNSSNLASLNMDTYVAELISHLRDIYVVPSGVINFRTSVDPFTVDLKQAVPIGLILNEAITNCIKYAFDDRGGEISIVIKLNKGMVEMDVADDGKGIPSGFDPVTKGSLGFRIMRGLSAQLKGEFRMENNSGTLISIRFPLKT